MMFRRKICNGIHNIKKNNLKAFTQKNIQYNAIQNINQVREMKGK